MACLPLNCDHPFSEGQCRALAMFFIANGSQAAIWATLTMFSIVNDGPDPILPIPEWISLCGDQTIKPNFKVHIELTEFA
jgi:hypothetical protein